VTEVVRFTRSDPSYAKYCRWTIVPEESATVSIVLNSSRLRVVERDLHFERWSDPYSGHPDVLRRADLEEVIGSGMPFARKFDLRIDPEVLDVLDAERQHGSRGIDKPVLPTAVEVEGPDQAPGSSGPR
jgi:hypothetical protein